MEKEEKGKALKCIGWTVLCYIIISVIAGICSIPRGMLQGDTGLGITWFSVMELFVIPVLFLIAGYVVSAKLKLSKFKLYKVFLGAVIFSGVLLALWYVLLEFYVVLNLPAAEGSTTLDLFLRRITVVIDYEVKYLKETDAYRYVMLPLIHFVFRIVYWLFYLWGNRIYSTKQMEAMRTKKTKR